MSKQITLDLGIKTFEIMDADGIKTAVEKSKARMENHTSSYQGTTKGLAPDQVLQS